MKLIGLNVTAEAIIAEAIEGKENIVVYTFAFLFGREVTVKTRVEYDELEGDVYLSQVGEDVNGNEVFYRNVDGDSIVHGVEVSKTYFELYEASFVEN